MAAKSVYLCDNEAANPLPLAVVINIMCDHIINLVDIDHLFKKLFDL